MNQQQPGTARVTQTFKVSAERVFDAWLNPELIGKFMFGPTLRDEAIVRLSVDARVGGHFSFVVRRQGQEIDHVGEYLEMDRPHRLAFTWGVRGESGGSSRVSIELVPTASGCQLTLIQEIPAEWAAFVERSQAAWVKMASVLVDVLSQAAVVERSIWINAPRERAWQAITQKEYLDQWYATRYQWEIPELKVGATVKFHNSDTEVLLARIEVLDPPRQFTLRWQMEPEQITHFLLQEENGGTLATISESVHESVTGEEREQWIQLVGQGYQMSIENLQALLEGRSLPH